MKKEVILVPQDKCPLDFLAEMGDCTRNSWIFLHDDLVDKLHSTADEYHIHDDYVYLCWHSTNDYVETTVILDRYMSAPWIPVHKIASDNIAFKVQANDPENIFFLNMAE